MFLLGPTLRLLLYSVLLGGTFQILIIYQSGLRGKQILSENGAVEDLQVGMLAVTSLVLFWAASRRTALSLVSGLLAVLPALAAVRELDNFFDDTFGKGVWGATVVVGLVTISVLAWWKRGNFRIGLNLLVNTSAHGFFVSAFVIVMVLSRLIGQQPFWRSINPNKYTRDTPRTVEELVELAGYFLLLFGAMELLALTRKLAASDQVSRLGPM